jgi:Uma2 family endonuclease
MSQPYEEIVEGERLLRFPPGERHESICARLHAQLADSMDQAPSARLLAVRTLIEFSPTTRLCPDLAVVTAASDKLWLVAEVISSDDHHADTVDKKSFYESMKLPRLWMVDPRYDNVEIYHGTQYGMTLKHILAGREVLSEPLLPGFQIGVHELFASMSGFGNSRQLDF